MWEFSGAHPIIALFMLWAVARVIQYAMKSFVDIVDGRPRFVVFNVNDTKDKEAIAEALKQL